MSIEMILSLHNVISDIVFFFSVCMKLVIVAALADVFYKAAFRVPKKTIKLTRHCWQHVVEQQSRSSKGVEIEEALGALTP
ncbi:3-isopropylmalate dehydratase small subunit [Frankliniella fusca]|uniref:3-isopropylmalate dehydratase small subunit n=1 Tax=Frankliniella fusca TaxID=407009 RepID=A0AAE1HJG2_9NEOP|nr:3-isopropylmalate dehydratase small subunit [Frankliniella fusca]